MSRLAASLAATVLFVLPTLVRAQASASPPLEFGADAAVTVLFDPSAVVLTIPVAEVRAGYFVTPKIEIEPRLGLTAANGSGDSYTEVHLTLGALYHLTLSRAAAQTYVRPFASFSSVKFTGSSETRAGALGIGLGVKLPVGTRFAFRPELDFAHTFAGDDVEDESRVQLLLGFSVYSH
jgi:hypothetical protein